MSQLPKTLGIPRVDNIESIDDVKEHLRKLGEILKDQHKKIYNDVLVFESIQFVLSGVRWRLIVVGDNLEIQKYESGSWVKKFAIV